jgi:glycosyltransferase involved in cell wall biosynthesis
MRIGVDLSNIVRGGGVTHIQEVFDNLDTCISTDSIVAFASKDLQKKLPKKEYIDYSIIPCGVYRYAWRFYDLPKELINNGVDLLFIPGGGYSNFKPYVTMCRNMLPFTSREHKKLNFSLYLKMKLLKIYHVCSYKKSNGLIFISKYAEKQISNRIHLKNDRTTVIYHGGSTAIFNKSRVNASRRSAQTSAFKLLYVSTLDGYKNHDTVIKAIHETIKTGYKIKLDLVGYGSFKQQKALKSKISKFNLDEIITYHGEVDKQKLNEFYQNADFFIFASSCENMPNILIEAMSAGLPIICSNVEPMPEFLGSTGLFFNPLDYLQLSEKINYLCSNYDKAINMGNQAHKKSKEYNWKQTAFQTINYLRSIYIDYNKIR